MSARAVNIPPKPSSFEKHVTCKDHLVSGETFDLLLDDSLDLLITSPKPKSDDLDKYYQSEDYISHTDSSASVLDFVYQSVRSYTLKKKLKLINSFGVENKRILDIGSGTGDFLKVCAENGWQVNGIEPNATARKIAEQKAEKHGGSFFETIEILKKEDNVFLGFDVITMWHVLEHVPNLDETIFNLKKLLKPDGILLVAVPNFKSFDADYYKGFWAAYDVPRHLWHFSQTAIRRLFFFQAMEVVQTVPMKFDSFYVSLLSEKYRKSNFGYIKAFWIGWISNKKARKTKEYSSLVYVIKNSKSWLREGFNGA